MLVQEACSVWAWDGEEVVAPLSSFGGELHPRSQFGRNARRGDAIAVELVRGSDPAFPDEWNVLVEGSLCAQSAEDKTPVCRVPPPLHESARLDDTPLPSVRPLAIAVRLESQALAPVRVEVVLEQVVRSLERSDGTEEEEIAEIKRAEIKPYSVDSVVADSVVLPYPFCAPSQSGLGVMTFRHFLRAKQRREANLKKNSEKRRKYLDARARYRRERIEWSTSSDRKKWTRSAPKEPKYEKVERDLDESQKEKSWAIGGQTKSAARALIPILERLTEVCKESALVKKGVTMHERVSDMRTRLFSESDEVALVFLDALVAGTPISWPEEYNQVIDGQDLAASVAATAQAPFDPTVARFDVAGYTKAADELADNLQVRPTTAGQFVYERLNLRTTLLLSTCSFRVRLVITEHDGSRRDFLLNANEWDGVVAYSLYSGAIADVRTMENRMNAFDAAMKESTSPIMLAQLAESEVPLAAGLAYKIFGKPADSDSVAAMLREVRFMVRLSIPHLIRVPGIEERRLSSVVAAESPSVLPDEARLFPLYDADFEPPSEAEAGGRSEEEVEELEPAPELEDEVEFLLLEGDETSEPAPDTIVTRRMPQIVVDAEFKGVIFREPSFVNTLPPYYKVYSNSFFQYLRIAGQVGIVAARGAYSLIKSELIASYKEYAAYASMIWSLATFNFISLAATGLQTVYLQEVAKWEKRYQLALLAGEMAQVLWKWSRAAEMERKKLDGVYWKCVEKLRGVPIRTAVSSARSVATVLGKIGLRVHGKDRFQFVEHRIVGAFALSSSRRRSRALVDWASVPDKTAMTQIPPVQVVDALWEAESLRRIPLQELTRRITGATRSPTPAAISAAAAVSELVANFELDRKRFRAEHLLESVPARVMRTTKQLAELLRAAYGSKAHDTLVRGNDDIWATLDGGREARLAARHLAAFVTADVDATDKSRAWWLPRRQVMDSFCDAVVKNGREREHPKAPLPDPAESARVFARVRVLAGGDSTAPCSVAAAFGPSSRDVHSANSFRDQEGVVPDMRKPANLDAAWASRRIDPEVVENWDIDDGVKGLVEAMGGLGATPDRHYYCPVGGRLDSTPASIAFPEHSVQPIWMTGLAEACERVLHAPDARRTAEGDVEVEAQPLQSTQTGLARHPLVAKLNGARAAVSVDMFDTLRPPAVASAEEQEHLVDLAGAAALLDRSSIGVEMRLRTARARVVAYNADRLRWALALVRSRGTRRTIVNLPSASLLLPLAVALALLEAETGDSVYELCVNLPRAAYPPHTEQDWAVDVLRIALEDARREERERLDKERKRGDEILGRTRAAAEAAAREGCAGAFLYEVCVAMC